MPPILRDAQRRALSVLSAMSAVVALLLLTAAPAAAIQVPNGAAWYTIYNLPKAWQISEGAGVTVAVLDSGVKTSIGDLQGKSVPGVDYTGQDPGTNHDDPKSTNYGHGTDMAAKIAGNGQGAGMIGVAPKAKIMPMDIGGAGAGLDASLVPKAIHDAVDRGAKVINLSFGGVGSCYPPDGAAIKYAYQHDVIVVAAAGDSPGPVNSPANCPGALAIGGLDAAGKPWVNTPSGSEIDFVSLAYNLLNEQLDGTLYGPYPGNNGTSSSAAFVSGMFALLIAHFPRDTARQIVTRALYWTHTGRGAAGIDKRVDDTLGYGELLPYNALSKKTPANATNPIYDRFDKELGLTKTGASSPPASSAATSGPGSASSAPSATPSTDTASNGSGGGVPTVAIIVVVLVGVIILAVALSRRGRRNNPPPPPYGY